MTAERLYKVRLDRLYYNIIIARDSITIRSSSNVRTVRKEDKK
ncbi:MAG: hypothetical protein WBL49_12860 [Nitrososphaeraceae archaeon]